MRLMKFLLSIMILLSFESLFAQGEYLDRGTNAISLGFSAAVHPKLVGLSGEAAVTTLGTVDLGLAYTYLFSRTHFSSAELYSSMYSPYVNIHAVKQSEIFPLSISACLQYDVAKVGALTYGAAVSHSFNIAGSKSLLPAIKYSRTEIKLNQYSDLTTTIPFTELSLSYVVNNGNKISVFNAGITLSEQEPIYSFGIGIVNIF